LEQEIR